MRKLILAALTVSLTVALGAPAGAQVYVDTPDSGPTVGARDSGTPSVEGTRTSRSRGTGTLSEGTGAPEPRPARFMMAATGADILALTGVALVLITLGVLARRAGRRTDTATA